MEELCCALSGAKSSDDVELALNGYQSSGESKDGSNVTKKNHVVSILKGIIEDEAIEVNSRLRRRITRLLGQLLELSSASSCPQVVKLSLTTGIEGNTTTLHLNDFVVQLVGCTSRQELERVMNNYQLPPMLDEQPRDSMKCALNDFFQRCEFLNKVLRRR